MALSEQIRANPHVGNVATDFQAAVAHHQAGRLDRAELLYKKVLRKAPTMPDALHLLGLIALSHGRAARAVELIQKALKHYSADIAEVHMNLGNAYLAAERRADAEASYRRAIALDPRLAAAHCNLGKILIDRGEFVAALAECRSALTLDKTLAEAYVNAAAALRALGGLTEAESELSRACAVALAPGAASCWLALGLAERMLGRFDAAERCITRAVEIDPEMTEARSHLAFIGRHRADSDEAARLAATLARDSTPVSERIVAGFALGKMMDDADRFDEAFTLFAEANHLFRSVRAEVGERFDAAEFIEAIDRLIEQSPPELLAGLPRWRNPSELPVFVVGMPRSGTTLIEQIAASHSQVFGAGEISDLNAISLQLAAKNRDVPQLQDWDADYSRSLADFYVDRLHKLGGDARRVINKTPDNIMLLGLVALLFPGARVVFASRDARDTCLSNFFQRFAHGNLFSYDLADCGARAKGVTRLAQHWLRVLPLRMLTVDYEALVGDLEGESRRLIDFLGLDWEPACLDFHRTERAVTTLSVWQVRQKIYTRSVSRWRHYERHLGPLLEALR